MTKMINVTNDKLMNELTKTLKLRPNFFKTQFMTMWRQRTRHSLLGLCIS